MLGDINIRIKDLIKLIAMEPYTVNKTIPVHGSEVLGKYLKGLFLEVGIEEVTYKNLEYSLDDINQRILSLAKTSDILFIEDLYEVGVYEDEDFLIVVEEDCIFVMYKGTGLRDQMSQAAFEEFFKLNLLGRSKLGLVVK